MFNFKHIKDFLNAFAVVYTQYKIGSMQRKKTSL